MRPSSILFIFLYAVVPFISLIDPVKAGDYYDEGYQSSRYDSATGGYSNGGFSGRTVRYSRDCCFEKVVRHEKSVRYVRTYGGVDRSSSYDRPYYRYGNSGGNDGGYSSGYNGGDYRRPYYRSSYDAPRSYAPSYTSGYGDIGYGSNCGGRRVRVFDGRGGWVWSVQSGC